jgi:hypothetical protein
MRHEPSAQADITFSLPRGRDFSRRGGGRHHGTKPWSPPVPHPASIMEPSDLTEATLFDILLDAPRRAELRAAMGREQGTRLSLSTHYSDVAYTAEDAAKLGAAVLAVLEDAAEGDWDDLLDPLLSNPGTPREALWAAYRQGRGIPSLGHRRGPRALLEALARDHRYAEAITSLALYHYAAEDDAFFRAFVERHRDEFMLRYNLRHSPLVPEHRRALVADLIGED